MRFRLRLFDPRIQQIGDIGGALTYFNAFGKSIKDSLRKISPIIEEYTSIDDSNGYVYLLSLETEKFEDEGKLSLGYFDSSYCIFPAMNLSGPK